MTLFCHPSSAPAAPDRTSQTTQPPPATISLSPSTARQPTRTPTMTLFCRPFSAPAAPDRASQTTPSRPTKTPRAPPPATISPRVYTSASNITTQSPRRRTDYFIYHFRQQAKLTKTNQPSHKQTTKQGSVLNNNPCFFISYSELFQQNAVFTTLRR